MTSHHRSYLWTKLFFGSCISEVLRGRDPASHTIGQDRGGKLTLCAACWAAFRLTFRTVGRLLILVPVSRGCQRCRATARNPCFAPIEPHGRISEGSLPPTEQALFLLFAEYLVNSVLVFHTYLFFSEREERRGNQRALLSTVSL